MYQTIGLTMETVQETLEDLEASGRIIHHTATDEHAGDELRNREHSPNRHTGAIALTAFAATEDRKRALLAGLDLYLSKHVDLDEVIAVVSRMASRRR